MRRRFLKNGSFFDYSKYMTIEVLEDGFTVRADRSVEYNVNGKGWNHLAAGFNTQPASKGDLLSFRCVLNIEEEFGSFKSNGKAVNLLGNVLSLIFGDSVETDISAYSGVFFNTFNGFNFPNIINIDKKFLSATTLASQCYHSMFYGCTSLTSAPVLPATTLADDCYHDMFRDCTSLVNAPELPATTLANGCYSSMFSNCTSLVNAPELPATTLANGCYSSMFSNCTSLVNAPELPATTLADRCYMYMFYGCTSLVNAPELPATALADNCYNSMFRDCTSLVNAPELPATTLADNCYNFMFNGCTKLNYIKAMFMTTPSTDYTSDWVYGVSTTGTFVKNKDATWDVRGASGIPNGWTVKTDDEENGGNSLFPATLIPTKEDNLPNYNIAKYFLDNYPDMVVDINGAYTPITEDVTIQGSNHCDGKVVGVAKWSTDENYQAVLFYTENSIGNLYGLRVFAQYDNNPQGSTQEWFFD